MTNAQQSNKTRQESAKAWCDRAQAASTQAMFDNNRAAWDAAQADMHRAESEWNAACKAAFNRA